MKTHRLTRAALFTAVMFVTTMLIVIPIPGTQGYVNASDSIAFLAAAFLPPGYAAAASGIGAALADMAAGYAIFIPATLVIKGLESFVAAYLFHKYRKFPLFLFLSASLLMPLGYFLFETALFGMPTALAAVLPNIGQGVFGAVLAWLLLPLSRRLAEFFPEKRD